MIKKVNWELTPELHLDDGKQYGGAVWLLSYGELRLQVIKWVREDMLYFGLIYSEVSERNALLKRWIKRFDITEEELTSYEIKEKNDGR